MIPLRTGSRGRPRLGKQAVGGKRVKQCWLHDAHERLFSRRFQLVELTAQLFRFALQLIVRAVEVGVGFGEFAMLGFELLQLLLEALHVLFFALAECPL